MSLTEFYGLDKVLNQSKRLLQTFKTFNFFLMFSYDIYIFVCPIIVSYALLQFLTDLCSPTVAYVLLSTRFFLTFSYILLLYLMFTYSLLCSRMVSKMLCSRKLLSKTFYLVRSLQPVIVSREFLWSPIFSHRFLLYLVASYGVFCSLMFFYIIVLSLLVSCVLLWHRMFS